MKKLMIAAAGAVLVIAACDRSPVAPIMETIFKHDTITKVDTVIVKTPRGVDTIYVPVVKHDTLTLPRGIDTVLVPVIHIDSVSKTDTVTHYDTVVAHDTTYEVRHDTVVIRPPQPPPQTDTLYIPIHDTTIVYVPQPPAPDTSGIVIVNDAAQDHYLVFYHGDLMGMVIYIGPNQWRALKYIKGQPTMILLSFKGGDFESLEAASRGMTFGWIEITVGPLITPIKVPASTGSVLFRSPTSRYRAYQGSDPAVLSRLHLVASPKGGRIQ